MPSFSTYYILTLLVTCVLASNDTDITKGGVVTKVKGQSGKIAVYRENESPSDGVTITFDAISEIDSSGDVINSHSFNNFAQLDFNVSNVNEGEMNNATAFMFNLKAKIAIDGKNATFRTEIGVFPAATRVKIDGAMADVKAGTMKFNIAVFNWPFCMPCKVGNKDYSGAYIDVDIEVKGKQQPKSNLTNKKYDLGGGASLGLSKMARIDMTDTEMPDGYPKFTVKGSKNIFTFRFAKFTTSAYYDPTVELSSSTGSTTQAPSGSAALRFEPRTAILILIGMWAVMMKLRWNWNFYSGGKIDLW